MFPQSLHKNIRELDKQITLLESECENMSATNRRKVPNEKILRIQKEMVAGPSKSVTRENFNRPFYTAPRGSEPGVAKKTSRTSATCKIHPRSSSASSRMKKNVKTKEASTAATDDRNKFGKNCPISENVAPQLRNKKPIKTSECGCKRDLNYNGINPGADKPYISDSENHILHKGVLHANPGGTIEVTVVQKSSKTPNIPLIGKRHSATSVRDEVEQKSDSDSSIAKDKFSNQKKNPPDTRTWSEILSQENKNPYDNKTKITAVNNNNNNIRTSYSLGAKCPDRFLVEPKKHVSVGDTQSPIPNLKFNKYKNEHITDACTNENAYPQSTVSIGQRKPRPKSPFSRKNIENVIDDTLLNMGGHYERGNHFSGDDKSCYSDRSLDPLRTMCALIEALKKNLTSADSKKLINELESSMFKLAEESQFKFSEEDNVEYVYEVRKQENEYVKRLQRHFLSMKKKFDLLTEEKNKLSEDLALKEQMLSTLTSKEKEYLSAITNLKVNLEKKRVLAEENVEVVKELHDVRNKLCNETKITDALRKSHAKMQDQIQKYVLENDKLKTEIRLKKLESQKYCVLLAGKDAEIKRYKDEVEAFQRQISDQLVALRSNNAANEVQKAMEAIMKQSQVFSVTDLDSAFSETQSEKGERSSSKQKEKLMHSSPTSTKSSIADSSWNHISSIHGDESKSNGDEVFIGGLRPGADSPGEDEPKPQSFVSCKSVEDLTQLSEVGCKELEVASSNARLRKDIEKLFEDLKAKCSQKMFSLPNESVIFEDLFNSSCTSDTSELSANFLAALEN